MKAAVLSGPGGPDHFYIEERALPVPGPNQVLVKVKAFGLNRSELMTRKGLSPDVKFPRVLGIECVGEVENDPGKLLAKGQKVAAFMGGMGRDFDGSYEEFAALPRSIILPFDSQLPWVQLGAIPEMFQTVYGSLHLALRIQSGETILVRGGTSSIGLLSIQMAKQSGLRVLATTRNKDREGLLLQSGADRVLIDDGHLSALVHQTLPGGVDKVLELVGMTTLKDSLHCAAPGGTVCMTGMLSEQWSVANFTPMDFIPATVGLTVYDSGQIRVGADRLQEFIGLVESGVIRLSIGRTFMLDDIAEAHRVMDSNAAGGKIVVLTDPF